MSKKGAIEERHIVHIFEQNGYSAIRIPASGGGTKLDRPDVLAGNNPRIMSIEEQEKLEKNLQEFGLVDPIIINLKKLTHGQRKTKPCTVCDYNGL